MDDPKHVPAIFTNSFGVGPLSGGVRIVFGQRLSNNEQPAFHSAVQMDREGAKVLIELLTQTLGAAPTGSAPGSKGSATGGFEVTIGSTTLH